jgi:hypothetical protein
MTFIDIATPLAALGIRVFPLSAGTKVPPRGMGFTRWASTDPGQMGQWNAEDQSYNVGMLATWETVWFLEFDIANGLQGMMAEMNVAEKPATRAQRSGRSFTQLVFRHNERSIGIGNRSVNLIEPCVNTECEQAMRHMAVAPYCPYVPCGLRATTPHHHHEWFSVRAHNKYLVGAGSTHPNGRLYETAWDVEPTVAPHWVMDFIEKHSVPEPKPPKDARSVREGWELESVTDFHEINLFPCRPDDPWKIVQECPGVDRMHDHSKRTGFYWDGGSVGWNCFAQNCPTMAAYHNGKCKSKMGSLLHFLAEKWKTRELEPYREKIWDNCEEEQEILEAFDVSTIGIGFSIKEAEVEPIVPPQIAASVVEETKTSDAAPKLVRISRIESEEADSMLVGVRASQITPKLLDWLWPGKIPKALALWTGKPDNGKSLSLIDLTSRVSRGADWPDGERNEMGPRIVLYFATEDNKQKSLVPRLMAAGANLDNVIFPLYMSVAEKVGKKETYESKINLASNLKMLHKAVENRPEIALIIFDPLNSYWEGKDENKSGDISPVLEGISKLCEDTGVTVLGLIHHSKRTDTDALGKVLGSVRVGAIARAVWEISKDDEKETGDEGAIRMALVKGNDLKKRSGMTYHIEEVTLTIEGKPAGVPRVAWDAELDKNANQLDAEKRERQQERRDPKSSLARALILSSLPCTPPELFEKGRQEGISKATIYRAKEEMDLGDDPIYSESIGTGRERRWWLTSQWNQRAQCAEAMVPDADAVM